MDYTTFISKPMKVIKTIKQQNINYEFPKRIECEHCGSTLEIEREDIHIGYLGEAYVQCPVCNQETCIYSDTIKETITPETIKFPDHFYHFGVQKGAVEIENGEIEIYIKKCVQTLREHPEHFVAYTGRGDTMVFVWGLPGDGEYWVVVAKGYYDGTIPFQPIDNEIWSNVDYG